MTRTVQDGDLRVWEVYASSGPWGKPDHARLLFQCLTDPARRARSLIRDLDLSEVEGELRGLSESELAALLDQAEELD